MIAWTGLAGLSLVIASLIGPIITAASPAPISQTKPTPAPSIPTKAPPVGAGYNNTGLGVGSGTIYDEESGTFFPAPPGYVPEDPNQYKYEFVCKDDVNGSCVQDMLMCPDRGDGKPGKFVQWMVAPRAISDPEWGNWVPLNGPTCLYDEKPEDILPAIAARILQDFQNLPIAPAVLTSQPSPHTLRGAETNIFADAQGQEFDVTILGQRVHLVATPVEYTYNYGDGTTLGPTPIAGGPINREQWGTKTRTSHVYESVGDFAVSVVTSFRGTYSVNGGPDLPVPGTGQFASPSQTLQVWRSVTRNYADDCNVNPAGEGCPG